MRRRLLAFVEAATEAFGCSVDPNMPDSPDRFRRPTHKMVTDIRAANARSVGAYPGESGLLSNCLPDHQTGSRIDFGG